MWTTTPKRHERLLDKEPNDGSMEFRPKTKFKKEEFEDWMNPKFIEKMRKWCIELVEWMETDGTSNYVMVIIMGGNEDVQSSFTSFETMKDKVRLWFTDLHGQKHSLTIRYDDIKNHTVEHSVDIWLDMKFCSEGWLEKVCGEE